MISFFKYQGAGNDFILLDERGLEQSLKQEQIQRMCHRRFGIGADGILILSPHETVDFAMTLYNADGKEGSLCGNGARCAVHAAYRMGFIDKTCQFTSCDGLHQGELHEDGTISITMRVRSDVEEINSYYFCDTGSPHLVTYVPEVEQADVMNIGSRLRNDASIREDGVNVNFVQVQEKDQLLVRTYERGVEDETLACGTGAVAVALIQAWKEDMTGSLAIDINMPGGKLMVTFDRNTEGENEHIRLRGPAESPYHGTWNPM